MTTKQRVWQPIKGNLHVLQTTHFITIKQAHLNSYFYCSSATHCTSSPLLCLGVWHCTGPCNSATQQLNLFIPSERNLQSFISVWLQSQRKLLKMKGKKINRWVLFKPWSVGVCRVTDRVRLHIDWLRSEHWCGTHFTSSIQLLYFYMEKNRILPPASEEDPFKECEGIWGPN